MKKILIVLALVTTLISCKSSKSGCDAYGNVNTSAPTDTIAHATDFANVKN